MFQWQKNTKAIRAAHRIAIQYDEYILKQIAINELENKRNESKKKYSQNSNYKILAHAHTLTHTHTHTWEKKVRKHYH